MSRSHVLEPTYNAIKLRLVVGQWPPGVRLEAVRLAADLGVSITPVRDSLNHLTGERLVELMPGEGFRVPTLNEAALRDLLNLNQLLLIGAIDQSDAPVMGSADVKPDLASATASLFLAMATVSGNAEIVAMVRALNDRLHPFRQSDDRFLQMPRPNRRRCTPLLRRFVAQQGPKFSSSPSHHPQSRADRYIRALAKGGS